MNQRPWWISAAAVAASLFLTASLLVARPGVVRTRDGKTIEGEIEETPDKIGITIRNIRTVVNRADVEGQVEYFDNVEARYQDKVSKLPKKPAAADHLALARWLFDVKSYDLALGEIDKAKKVDPNSADAATLEATVMSQRRIEMSRPGTGATGTAPRPATGTGATGAKPPAGSEKSHMLTPEDINTIRQMEWRDVDTAVPRVSVPVDVRNRYVQLKALKPGEFAALSGAQQAYYILQDGPPEMRKDIKVTTDPQSLAEYRRTVQPLIINNCATAGCHGGHNAGRFFLYSQNADRDEVAMTNFFILQSYKQGFGDREYSMIDRTYPDHSILAQFALHPDAAELDHPEIKGQAYKAIAANQQAAGYKTITNWMKNLQAGEPSYGITYALPVSNPNAKAPATKPATPKPKAGGGGGAPATPPATRTPAAGAAAPAGATPAAAPAGQ